MADTTEVPQRRPYFWGPVSGIGLIVAVAAMAEEVGEQAGGHAQGHGDQDQPRVVCGNRDQMETAHVVSSSLREGISGRMLNKPITTFGEFRESSAKPCDLRHCAFRSFAPGGRTDRFSAPQRTRIRR